jgi:guanylate cyclase
MFSYDQECSPTINNFNNFSSVSCLNFVVYLFIGEHIALVDFVKALHGLKVLGNGDYMIISIDDFIFDPESNAQEYTSRSKLSYSQF